ncbi:hypothetical protein [Achromobacter insolitus]|uniref:hypothetical protein n=1 Tax=Achromobacter insolitus TaxID=217204 RepID=UPI001041C747|nr:hypothetical protein [Achromobacter insolitus]
MQQNHAPSAKKDEIVQQLNALNATDQRARLRALLPLIDRLVRQGVPHAKIVESLINADFPVTLVSLRKALYRWRKRSGPAPEDDNLPDGHSTPNTEARLSGPSRIPDIPAPGGIQSKADLVRLRQTSDHIDLNELAEIGRKK